MERIQTHFEEGVVPPFVLPPGVERASDLAVSVAHSYDGTKAKGMNFWGLPRTIFAERLWNEMSPEEKAGLIVALQEDPTSHRKIQHGELRFVDAVVHAKREEHIQKLAHRRSVPSVPADEALAGCRQICISSGVNWSGRRAYVTPEGLRQNTPFGSELPHTSFGIELQPAPSGSGRLQYLRRVPLLDDYLSAVPFASTVGGAYTALYPTEEAAPMIERAEEHLAMFEAQMKEVDPLFYAVALTAGWLRQTHCLPTVPRSEIWPGHYDLLYVSSIDGWPTRTVYFDDLAWELVIGYGRDYLTTPVYLTPDGEFICSQLCQNEIGGRSWEQPLVGKLNKYTLQTWLASAGVMRRTGPSGSDPREETPENRSLRPRKYAVAAHELRIPDWMNDPAKAEAMRRLAEFAAEHPRHHRDGLAPNRIQSVPRYVYFYGTRTPGSLQMGFRSKRCRPGGAIYVTRAGTPEQRAYTGIRGDVPRSLNDSVAIADLGYYPCPIWVEDAFRLIYGYAPRNTASVTTFLTPDVSEEEEADNDAEPGSTTVTADNPGQTAIPTTANGPVAGQAFQVFYAPTTEVLDEEDTL